MNNAVAVQTQQNTAEGNFKPKDKQLSFPSDLICRQTELDFFISSAIKMVGHETSPIAPDTSSISRPAALTNQVSKQQTLDRSLGLS
jgi:hypothetical protein